MKWTVATVRMKVCLIKIKRLDGFIGAFSFLILLLLVGCESKKQVGLLPVKKKELHTLAVDLFTDCEGCMLLYHEGHDQYSFIGPDTSCLNEGTLPASTFKIPNSAIMLEHGVVSDMHHIIPWDGQARNFEIWEKNMGLKEAYKVSCLPCYQQLTRQLPIDSMRATLGRLEYPCLLYTSPSPRDA